MSRFLRGLNAIAYSGALLFSAFGFTTAAHAADDWPTKPITIIVPASPGGGTDIVLGLLAGKKPRNFGGGGGVENKAGGGGLIGTQKITSAKTDGLTLSLGNIWA